MSEYFVLEKAIMTSMVHVSMQCWFGKARSKNASLFTTFDYFLEPLEEARYPLSPYQTGFLAHKSKYVTIMTYERVLGSHDGQSFIKEIQPCFHYYDESIEAFRSGTYTVVVNT